MTASSKKSGSRAGVATLDLLCIILLLAGVVVLAMRGSGLAEKRDQAERLKRELGVIAEAVAEVAEEKELEPGAVVTFADYAKFLPDRSPRRLREDGEDQLGGKFGPQEVGAAPSADPATVEALANFLD